MAVPFFLVQRTRSANRELKNLAKTVWLAVSQPFGLIVLTVPRLIRSGIFRAPCGSELKSAIPVECYQPRPLVFGRTKSLVVPALFSLPFISLSQTQVDWSQIKNKPIVTPSGFTFTLTPGIPLSSGVLATITNRCPLGVNAANPQYYLYISGGTGTAEAVLVTGGTCVSGAPVGTLQFTPVNNHTGAWTLTSASQGIQEAVCSLPAAGGSVYLPAGPYTKRANISGCGKTGAMIERDIGATFTDTNQIFGVTPNSTTGPYYELFSSSLGVVRGDQAGQYNNSPTAFSYAVQGILGAADCRSQWQNGQEDFTGAAAEAVSGCADAPNSSTNHEVSGAFFSVTNASINTAATAISSYARATASGTGTSDSQRVKVWALNTLVKDGPTFGGAGSFTNTKLIGGEWDFNVYNTSTSVIGASYGGNSSATPSSSLAVNIANLGAGIPWSTGFGCADGATSVCLSVGVSGAGNNLPSQSILIYGRDSGGTARSTQLTTDAAGDFIAATASGTLHVFSTGGVNVGYVRADGGYTQNGVPYASLGAAVNGTILYCNNCTKATPCGSGGTGAMAKGLNGSWDCN